MAFELSVQSPEILPDLETIWLESLSKIGLICEFHPSFTVETWCGGFLPIKVIVRKNSFPLSDKYGDEPLFAGFELDIDSYEKSIFEIDELNSITVSQGFLFRTAMRRSVIDLRVQCFAAATLANILKGVVVDLQMSENFIGQEALRNAEREARAYEEHYAENFEELLLFQTWR